MADRIITAHAFAQALADAGLIHDLLSVHRIIIDAKAGELVKVYVERHADERWLDVMPTLDGIEVQTGDAGKLARLRTAVQQVLDDEESGKGGWGPDITMVTVLREAMDETRPSRQLGEIIGFRIGDVIYEPEEVQIICREPAEVPHE